jgi:hypothetical protein
MFPTLTPFWSPTFRAPFSGDVRQEIVPRFFSPEIKGSPEIERRIETEVASYGKQLGKVLEALQELAARTGAALPEIDALVEGVERVKSESKDALLADAERALSRLKAADGTAWAALTGQ